MSARTVKRPVQVAEPASALTVMGPSIAKFGTTATISVDENDVEGGARTSEADRGHAAEVGPGDDGLRPGGPTVGEKPEICGRPRDHREDARSDDRFLRRRHAFRSRTQPSDRRRIKWTSFSELDDERRAESFGRSENAVRFPRRRQARTDGPVRKIANAWAGVPSAKCGRSRGTLGRTRSRDSTCRLPGR
jgi:hypothetical protein